VARAQWLPNLAGWQLLGFWTLIKSLVWLGGAATLFRPDGPRAWVGTYRGGGLWVALLAMAWGALDALALWLGLKPAPGALAPAPEWVAILVVAPLLEELLFRGVLWSAGEAAAARRWYVWLISAAGFALWHLPGWIAQRGLAETLIPELIVTFNVGLLCGAGRWITGSVWAAVLLHLVNNAVSIGLFR
jgi:membrane protease YdiL (CAAX protease family)